MQHRGRADDVAIDLNKPTVWMLPPRSPADRGNRILAASDNGRLSPWPWRSRPALRPSRDVSVHEHRKESDACCSMAGPLCLCGPLRPSRDSRRALRMMARSPASLRSRLNERTIASPSSDPVIQDGSAFLWPRGRPAHGGAGFHGSHLIDRLLEPKSFNPPLTLNVLATLALLAASTRCSSGAVAGGSSD